MFDKFTKKKKSKENKEPEIIVEEKVEVQPVEETVAPAVEVVNVQNNLEMDYHERVEEILRNSVISKYMEDKGITDINFDGVKLRLQHNQRGAIIVENAIDAQQVKRLAKQMADLQRRAFTNSQPILDTEFGYIRVNAIHETVSPDGVSMSLRISRPRLAATSVSELTHGKDTQIEELLNVLIKAESNIVIAGRTGSGKTEFQKMLVGLIDDSKVIGLIEDTRDSHIKALYPNKFIYSWQTLLSEDREKKVTISDLVKAMLRSNPDWVIISETRGVEAADILDSVKTDHSIITTIHARGAANIPSRLIPMIRQAPAYSIMSDVAVGREIVEFLRFGIYMQYEFENGKIVRRIKEIMEYTDYSERGLTGTYLYRRLKEYNKETGQYEVKEEFNPLSEQTLRVIRDKELIHLLPERFMSQ